VTVCIVTGAGGLIGAESVRQFSREGHQVVGVDNDLRAYFFGQDASTAWSVHKHVEEVPGYRHVNEDIRDEKAMEALFAEYGSDIAAVIHTAAQPSHDWAAREPFTDFTVNANGTLVLLEMARRHCPQAGFVFCSTNKVYGDAPNRLPLVELPTRYEVSPDHPYHGRGIDEDMSLDQCTHSLFGCSKVAADVLVQEYGRYFGMNTVCFRGGCLTGSGHSGAELHGFLAYLMRCAITHTPYTIFGYRGKQVRDNIHAADLVSMFRHYLAAPRPAKVYNAGGGTHSNCSMAEAIALCEEITGRPMQTTYQEQNRIGDHIWWVSDVSRFRADYPDWSYTYGLRDILQEIHDNTLARL